MSDLDKFDPNALPDQMWATYCPGRWTGGAFRTHAQRGHALSALGHQHEGIIYKWEDGRWVEVARRRGDSAPQRCERCGESVMQRSRYGADGLVNAGIPTTLRDPATGKVAKELQILHLCGDCYRLESSR
jgi:hypothetical protein